MNSSVIATEMLKLVTEPSRLQSMNSQDVGVVDAQDAHVGAASRAALLDRLGGCVEDLHEADGAGGDAVRRGDHAALGRRREKEKPVPPPL